MPQLLIAFLLSALLAGANTAGFEIRAHALEQRWQAAEAAGVPADRLAGARGLLAAERARHVGILPYPSVSGAALTDPLGPAEAAGDAAIRAADAAARDRARTALARLRDASGPAGPAAYRDGLGALGRASRPRDLDALARRWDREAAGQEDAGRRLAGQAGGLSQGLPADVVAAAARLADVEDGAARVGISTRDAGGAMVRAQRYLASAGYPELLAGHQAVLAQLNGAADALQRRLDARSRADQVLAEIPDLLDVAAQYGAGPELKARADQVRGALDAARAAHDEDGLDRSLASLVQLDDDLHAAAAGRLPTAGIACQQGAPRQLIVIHLASQQLVAYDGGCPILRTPVTTGRPALPTGRGTFQVFYKSPTYHMVSPWPKESPFYYPPTWVANAMEFIGDGTFLHSASWQPDDSYGPGSQYGAYASHGCVHVMDGPLQQLYDWAALGATVVVED
jgi:lipoprotein-anchoring transpeptidase ErfK/SrfK